MKDKIQVSNDKLMLSESAHGLLGQPMFKVLQRVKQLEQSGKDIIHFEIGDPDFDTPENIKSTLIESIKNGNTHYTSSTGQKSFKEAIIKATERSRLFKPDIDQILVCPGANIIIYYALACLVNKGENVLVPNRAFQPIIQFLIFLGLMPFPFL